ncbi:hypothetical protein JR316_0012353 [Psilocybe cubensis]|uniref:Uncharacterized protein n=1 Tax=Psilocybe cubensis TaxID=181762 RepID=A0ACB8GIL5_PSICU|nr:hypothetical protein JR316_0012353 [Psilocybe cubensis]KAH9475242.1 hypothetical protein JR316_0012353 [Psilocybe cubensis]
MSAEVVRRVFLNSNNPSDSSNTVHSDTSSTSRPIVANDAEVTLLREQLNTAQRQRAEAAAETNRLNDVLATTRRESMSKSNEINSLKQQLRDNAYALEQSLNSHTSYRASAQGIFESFQNENNRLKNEIMELKAELRVANSHIQASRGRDPAASTAAQSTLGSSSSSIPDEPPSARVQSQQTARIPSALNGRVIRTGNISNTNTSLLAPAVSPVSTVPHPAPAQAQAPRPRALKRGADILCRGYRRPQQTAVPELAKEAISTQQSIPARNAILDAPKAGGDKSVDNQDFDQRKAYIA